MGVLNEIKWDSFFISITHLIIFIEYRTLGSQARKYRFMQSGLKYCEDHRFWFIATFGKRKRAKDFMRDCRIRCS